MNQRPVCSIVRGYGETRVSAEMQKMLIRTENDKLEVTGDGCELSGYY